MSKMSKKDLTQHLIKNPGEYTMNDVMDLSGLAMQSTREVLKLLEAQGKCHKTGKTRGTKWVVTG